MRPPPNWTKFPRRPIVAGTILLAAAVTIAWWAKLWDISVLFATAEIRRGQVWRLFTGIFRHLDILHLLFQSLLAVGLRIPHRGGVWTCQNRRTHSFLCSRIKFFRARICLRPRGAFRVGYGLFGLLWVLSRRDERFRDSIDPRTVVVFVVWFFCIATTLTHTFPFPRATNARCSPPKKFSPQIKCYFRARAAYRKQCTVWSFTRPVACMKA